MDEAMIAQLEEHFRYEAVVGVEHETATPTDRILGARMLLTNKLETEGGWKPKARLICAGHRDPDGASTETSSQTAVLLGHMFLLVVASHCRLR